MIKIYVYTAFNGYAWHGCDEQTANDLRSFMEATGTLPKGTSDSPPYGGAVRCIIGGETGTGVYRYLVRERGDAFGRDSMYLSFAFVPSSDGRVDFAKLLECPEMAEPRPGEPKMLAIDASRFPLEGESTIPESARGVWWTQPNSFKLTRDAVNEAARLFFLPESHLGLLRAVFEKGEGGFSAQMDYSVFRQVEEFERRRCELDQHPGSRECVQAFSAALDALNQRAKALGGFEGLRKFAEMASNRGSEVAEREQMKNGVMAAVKSAADVARAFSVNCAEWPSCPARVDDSVLKRALSALDAAAIKAAAVISADDKLKKEVAEVHAGLTGQIIRVGQFNTQVREALNGTASDLRSAMLRLLMSRAVDPGPFFKGLAEWARRQFESRQKSSPRRSDELAVGGKSAPSPAKGHSVIPLIISFICGAALSLLVIWFVQGKPSANTEQPPSVGETEVGEKGVQPSTVPGVPKTQTILTNDVAQASSNDVAQASSNDVAQASSNDIAQASSNVVVQASSNVVAQASSNIVAQVDSAELSASNSVVQVGTNAPKPQTTSQQNPEEKKKRAKEPKSEPETDEEQLKAVVPKAPTSSKDTNSKDTKPMPQQHGTSDSDKGRKSRK